MLGSKLQGDSGLLPERPKKRSWRSGFIGFLAFFAGLMLYRHFHLGGFMRGTHGSRGPEIPPPMDVFQVYPPVRVGQDYLPAPEKRGSECSVVLMEHVFGFSYGQPFVGAYVPPKCEWTNVLFNLTMTSAGRQFDRLAVMFVGDVEVFRTSTAEPTWYGIEFNYVKDMTAYASLMKMDQTIIFELGNLVDDTYTGSFNATLTATFYSPTPMPLVPEEFSGPADVILAISHLSDQNQPTYYRLPQDRARKPISLPPSTIRATVSISASGNAAEEFWYTNVPDGFTDTFGAENSLPGHSPFREVQLLADGVLLGVAWPFAVIFTGGINPALWQPIVGISAFDIPEYEIDITPFLPLLLQPEPPIFEIKLVAWDASIDTDWIVSGRVFVWTDPHDANWITTGTIHTQYSGAPTFHLTSTLETDAAGTHNTSLELHLTAQRFLSVTSTIVTSSGPRPASWTQGLSYSHTNLLSANGSAQTVQQVTQGSSAATGTRALTFRWPLTIDSVFDVDVDGNFMIYAHVDRAVETAGYDGTLQTRQNGTAVYKSAPAYMSGETQQEMSFAGVPRNAEGVGSYRRSVKAVGGSLVHDEELLNGKVVGGKVLRGAEEGVEMEMGPRVGGGRRSVRSILGRGPG